MRTLTFTVQVPAKGTDGKPLDPQAVKSYIQDAVEDWSGQFNPDEDSMFYWAKDKTVVRFMGGK